MGGETMNDEFLKRYRKEPRPDFVEALYKTISRPVNEQRTIFQPRRLALALTMSVVVVTVVLAVSPSAQAFANTLIRKIGAIVLIDQSDQTAVPLASPAPTAPPPAAGLAQYAQEDAEIGRLAGFQPVTPGYLPAGYVAQGPWSIVPMDGSMGVYRQYRDPSGDHFLVFNPVRHADTARFEQGYGGNETLTDVFVRGHSGVWIVGRLFADSSGRLVPTNWLMWAEDGVNYTLYSDELPLDEMLKVAESLR
jgi:hypothetical protein